MFNKLISKLVLFLIVVSISAPLVFAQAATPPAAPAATPAATGTPPTVKEDKLGSFKVSDWLKIPDGQTYLDSGKIDEKNKTGLKNGLVYFVIKIIELLTKIIGSFALLFLITGGLILMASHGNSQLQTRGKQMILYSLLGIVIAFGSLIIVTFVQSLFFTA